MAGMRYVVNLQLTPEEAPETLFSIVAPATSSLLWESIEVNPLGATAAVVNTQFDVCKTDVSTTGMTALAAGEAAILPPVKSGDAEAIAATLKKKAAGVGEPANPLVRFKFASHPETPRFYQFPVPGGAMLIRAGEQWTLRWFAPSSPFVAVGLSMIFQE